MNTKKVSEIAIIFMGIVLFVFLLKEFASFLRPFAIAVIMTFLFIPLTRLSSKKKWSIIWGTLVSIFVLIGVVFGVSFLFSGSDATGVVEEGFTDKVKHLISTDVSFFGNSFSLDSVVDPKKIQDIISGSFKFIFSSTTTFISELFLIVLFVSFLLPAHEVWVSKVSKNLKSSDKKFFLSTLNEIEKSIRDYLRLKSVVSLGTAVVSFVIMLLFGVKFAALFALAIFGLNFIPNIGSIIAVGAVIISHFVDVGFSGALIVLLILLILVQLIFGNVIEPKMAGDKLDISPIVVILSLFFWGSIWGIGGMLFSVPLTVLIKILYTKFVPINS